MTTTYNYQSFNATPASSYNLNTASSSVTQLTNWNNTLKSASSLINTVPNGTLKSQFVNPNGSIQINLTTGSLFLDGVSVAGTKLNLTKLVVSNTDNSTVVTIEGSVSID